MDIFSEIRTTCLSLVGSSVRVNPDAARAFAAELPQLAEFALNDGVDFPLALNDSETVDLTVLSSMLAFGSGFRAPLHAALGAGASDTMIRGTLRFYLEGRAPTAATLAALSLADVASIFELPLHVDGPSRIQGVTISQAGPLRPLAEGIAHALTSAGRELAAGGAQSFDEFLEARKDSWVKSGEPPQIGPFVFLLASSFTAFNDESTVAGARVLFLKKAQLCAKELARKFPTSPLYGFSSDEVAKLTAFADNVLPAVLRAKGVLEIDPPLAARIDAGELLLAANGDDAHLRAAAITAVDVIVKEASLLSTSTEAPPMTAAKLDALLWKLGKRSDMRVLARHATQDTIAY